MTAMGVLSAFAVLMVIWGIAEFFLGLGVRIELLSESGPVFFLERTISVQDLDAGLLKIVIGVVLSLMVKIIRSK